MNIYNNSCYLFPHTTSANRTQHINHSYPKRLSHSIDSVHFGHASTEQEFEQLILDLPGFEKNREWAQQMWRCVEAATEQLNQGQLHDLREILDYFSENYQRYNKGKGRWRYQAEPRVYSPISGPTIRPLYALRRKNYAERAFKLVDSHGSYDQQYLRGNPKIYFFEEDGISLTGIVLYNDKNLGWYYVSAQKSQHVLPKTDKMYQEALALKGHLNKNNLEDAIQRIASIHWWMIQALPFNGGAAGITDMLTKTLFKHLGIQTSKWRPGIAPDMEALTTPLEEYVHNYPTFFQKPLELAQND